MIIGAHVSTAGGLHTGFQRAEDIGAMATQIFLSPPQQWAQKKYTPEEIALFKCEQQRTNIGPNFTHGIYLINLATDLPSNLHLAKEWLIYAQNMAGELGLAGTIFHLGSHKGRGFEAVKDQVCKSLEKILSSSPQGRTVYSSSEQSESRSTDTPYLILENSAGAGGSVGGKLSELGALIKAVGDPRLKVCLDTQHAFVSGYDLRTQEGVEQLITEFEQEIGLDKLAVIHANDSKTEFNSGRDRHENIGQGQIGLEGFRHLINHPKLQAVPFIMEVPGEEDKGPDKKNVETMHSLLTH